MKRAFLFAAGICLVLASPASAKPKNGVPPGQIRKAEVQEAKRRGLSPGRKVKNPPVDVYRSWDRDRVYYWNDDRYRWSGNTWIIVID